MKVRKRVLAGAMAAAAIVAAVVLVALYLRSPSPVYVDGRSAREWSLDLLSADYQARGNAQAALRKLGQAGVPDICLLLSQFPSPWERYLSRLGAMLPFLQADAALDPVLCRQRGAEMIALLGPEGAKAVPYLLKSLGSPESAKEAERALLRIGEASVPGLLNAVRGRQAEIRARAVRLLKEFPGRKSEWVPAVIGALADAEPRVRKEAAMTLGRSGLASENVLGPLVRATGDEMAEVRAAASEALGELGRSSPEILRALRARLQDSIPLVRLEAAKAYWALTRESETVVPVLMGVLPTQEGWQAAYALGNLGAAAAPAVPALIEVMKREKVPRAFRTPPSSCFALGKIQEAAIPALIGVLEDPEPGVRLAAVLAFGFMGPQARAAVPNLLRMLKDPEPEVRQVAAITLAGAGVERDLVLGSLADCLQAEDIYMRSTAAALLRQIAPEQQWTVGPE